MGSDDGDLVRAVADDFLAEFPPDQGPVEPDDVYSWMIEQAAKLDA